MVSSRGDDDDAKLDEAESLRNLALADPRPFDSSPTKKTLKRQTVPGEGRRVLHGNLGNLLFQSGDSTVLEDDAVPE